MRRATLSATIIATIALFASSRAFGQAGGDAVRDSSTAKDRWYAGLSGSLSRDRITDGFPVDRDDCHCGTFDEGTGTGWQAGVALRYRISDVWNIDGRLTFDARTVELETSLPDLLVLLPGTNTVVNEVTIAGGTIDLAHITTDIMLTARVELTPGFSITASAGPALGVVQHGTQMLWIDFIEPEFSPPFADVKDDEEWMGRRLYYSSSEDIPSLNSLRLSARVGGGVELGVGDLVTSRLGVYYDHELTDQTESEPWRNHAILFTMDVLVRL